jgi:hypothetical protein
MKQEISTVKTWRIYSKAIISYGMWRGKFSPALLPYKKSASWISFPDYDMFVLQERAATKRRTAP